MFNFKIFSAPITNLIDRSSCDDNEILITKNDVLLGSLNNIAAVIVHESKHLQYVNNNILVSLNVEEIECFTYEKNFLLKIPNV